MISVVRPARTAFALALATTLAGCAASPRQRPIETTRVADSGITLQSVRRQFEGRWTLAGLEYRSPDGRRSVIEGTMGTLTADAFGNMSVEYRMSPTGIAALAEMGFTAPNPVISTTGVVAIDIDLQSVAYLDNAQQPFDPAAAAGRANPFALERVRYYAFSPDGTLTLTTRYDDGSAAVVSTWKR